MIKIEKITTPTVQQIAWDIRHEVFVIGQNCPKEIEYEFEEESIHFIAYFNNEPAGTARIRQTENGYKLERFAVLEKFRGNGIGSALVAFLLNETIPFGKKIYLHAQLTAAPLYAKHNFKPEGENFWEADIEHVKMVYSKP
jgi:predicted GNAT family N-acyltransferase